MSAFRTSRAPTHGLTVLLVCFGTTSSVIAISAAGCDERPTLSPTSGAGGGTGGSGGGTTTTTTEDKAKALFADLEPELFKTCGVCHDANGSSYMPFLKAPAYDSITQWPGMITKDPNESKLLKHAVQGGKHSGPNLDSAALKDTLLPKVKDWLAEEAKQIADTPKEQLGKSTPPFTPLLGFNAIYLSSISKDLEGMEVTFTATELTATTLELTAVQVTPTPTVGVHIVHPLFSVYPKGGNANPDPADSFSNVDQYVDPGGPQPLGPGTLILTNWAKNAKLQLSFETLEKISKGGMDGGSEDGGPTGGCMAVDQFEQNAAPQLQQCLMCHGGANSMAAAAVDMSGLVNGVNVAGACAQVLNRVNPADPPKSQLFLPPDQNQEPAHPYKLSQTALDAFKGAVSKWVAAEKK